MLDAKRKSQQIGAVAGRMPAMRFGSRKARSAQATADKGVAFSHGRAQSGILRGRRVSVRGLPTRCCPAARVEAGFRAERRHGGMAMARRNIGRRAPGNTQANILAMEQAAALKGGAA